ncbi:hypothetical protein [Vagococcus sp.]|uniref:hypothetical protein n=1 Tax=Vagococcus sp. TaxID=1933889 RepID=UPI002FC84FA3
MKKKLTNILFVILPILIGWFIYSNIRINKPEMIKINGTIYIMTNEPTSKEKDDTPIGIIEKKIPLYQIPSENNTSNSLKENTKLYSRSKRLSLPNNIIFERDGQYFIATEKDMSDEQ